MRKIKQKPSKLSSFIIRLAVTVFVIAGIFVLIPVAWPGSWDTGFADILSFLPFVRQVSPAEADQTEAAVTNEFEGIRYLKEIETQPVTKENVLLEDDPETIQDSADDPQEDAESSKKKKEEKALAKKKARKAAKAKKKARIEKILSETQDMDIFQKLNYLDTYICGDSRCVGFAIYTDLDINHVLAETSTTVKYVEECLPAIEAAQPTNFVISFGMNDMGMYTFDPDNFWQDGEAYAEALKYYTDMIHSVSPDTHVFWNSIIPATQAGIDRQWIWGEADNWNAAMKKACEDYPGADFIDVSDLFYAHPEAYSDDGVHFAGIYDHWAEVIFGTILRSL